MASEREKLLAEAWKLDVQPRLERPLAEVGSFHRIVGLGEAMTGSLGMLATALTRHNRPLSRPGRLPIAFLLAVTDEAVHAFDYTHRGRDGVRPRAEVGRWPHGLLHGDLLEGREEPYVVLEWEGGGATCRPGVNASSVIELLEPVEH